MNKTIKYTTFFLALAIIYTLTTPTASATSIDYSQRCDVTLPATQFRTEITYKNIGIYGRNSFGQLECYTPGHSKPKNKPKITEAPKVCSIITEENCSTEKVCERSFYIKGKEFCLEYKKFCNGNETYHPGYWEGTGRHRHYHESYTTCSVAWSYYECETTTRKVCE